LGDREILGRIGRHARAIFECYDATKNYADQRQACEKYPKFIFWGDG
jgi:hypothetical protein